MDCNRIDSYYWNYNKDKNNWLCSGQGKTDLQVCGGFGQAINSSIASNLFGIFKIVWQGRKVVSEKNVNNIYSALWDSSKDILYSSGQGLYDILEITNANHPLIVTDSALNFYITGTVKDNIKYKACSLGVCNDTTTGSIAPETNLFETFCYPGSSSFLSNAYDEIKMRVYKGDISGSLVVNDEKVIPVIDKKIIRLDIDGIVGAYAVRVRNIEDKEWGEWINIDNELLNEETGDDLIYDAYRIDNSRFLVKWGMENNNGLRRICCQILTIYGISNTFCIEVLANFEIPQHIFKFYTSDERDIEFPTYNDQYVLSLDAEGVVTNVDGSRTVYFDTIFSDPVYKIETGLIEYGIADVNFNVVQQGINNKRGQSFDSVSPQKFSGHFSIYSNDGIFNKDGTAFIEVLFSDMTSTESCGSDNRDTYNLINADLEEVSNIDLLPEEVYEKYQNDKLSKSLDINKFKQNYNKDDINFKFGQPGYYKD